MNAQEFNDEMKKKLRESLIMPEQKPLQHEPQKSIQLFPHQNKEVLKVSPSTKLPTRFDRFQTLYPPEDYEVNLSFSVTNQNNKSQVDRSKIDYSKGKPDPVPDARSITQWAQNTRGDYGTGVAIPVGDIDPVRAIQRYKARKRKEKVDMILKAYGQD